MKHNAAVSPYYNPKRFVFVVGAALCISDIEGPVHMASAYQQNKQPCQATKWNYDQDLPTKSKSFRHVTYSIRAAPARVPLSRTSCLLGPPCFLGSLPLVLVLFRRDRYNLWEDIVYTMSPSPIVFGSMLSWLGLSGISRWHGKGSYYPIKPHLPQNVTVTVNIFTLPTTAIEIIKVLTCIH